MPEQELKSFSISSLISKLHKAILFISKEASEVSKKNNEISFYDIRELRDHITERLNSKEDIEDKEKLLKLLNLFATDKEVIEFMKDETEEWAKLLQAIEESLIRKQEGLTNEEKLEIEEIVKLTRDIRGVMRKEE